MTPYEQGYHSMMSKLGFVLKAAQPTPEQIAAMKKNVQAGKQEFAAGAKQRAMGAAAAVPGNKNPLLAKKGPAGSGPPMAAPRP